MKRIMLFLLGVMMVAASVPAFANGVVADGVLSDILIVYSPTRAIWQQVSTQEGTEIPNNFYRVEIPNIVDMSQFFNPTILLESPGVISDVVAIGTDITGAGFLGFISDSETTPVNPDFLTVPGAHIFPESQQTIWDVTYLLAPDLRALGYTATFASDAEVPEPATMLLLSSGLIGLAGYGRRKFFKK